jgi:trehalose/maltose transport system permease protein
MRKSLLQQIGLWVLIVIISVYALFPFYYAIITSFKSGSAIFQVTYWPTDFSLANYVGVLRIGSFPRNILNSIIVSFAVVVLSLLHRDHGRLCPGTGALQGLGGPSLHHPLGLDVPADRGPGRALRDGPRARALQHLLSLVLAYMIFTLPFSRFWVLTTFMRDLPIELEEAAIVDGAKPHQIIFRVFMPLMWPALVTTGLWPSSPPGTSSSSR